MNDWFLVAVVSWMVLGFSALCAIPILCSAYRNGVTDGYGYSREPACPGYTEAGKYLKKHMAYRWPELLDSSVPEVSDRQNRTMHNDPLLESVKRKAPRTAWDK